MIGTLTGLFVASVAFVGAHFVLSSRPVRDPLVARLGTGIFSALYSILVVLPFVWMIWAYRAASSVELWDAPTGIKHITLSVMIVAAIFAVASFSRDNPAVVGAPPPKLSTCIKDGPLADDASRLARTDTR